VSFVPDVSSGWQHDVAVDANDDPHVTFVYSDEGVKYRKKTGGVWGPIELVSSTWDPSFTSIAVDAANYPHFAYDKDDFGAVCYRAKTASGWQSEETIGTGGGWNTYGASIVVAGGEELVVYYSEGDLKFAMKTAGGWVSEDVDTTGDVGTHTSLAIDNEGYAHIAYRDATNELLKYAKSTEPVVGVRESEMNTGYEARGPSISAHPNPFKHVTQIRFTIPDSRSIEQKSRKRTLKIYNAAGQVVKSFYPESCIFDRVSSIRWDGTDQNGRQLSSGVYFLRLSLSDIEDSETNTIVEKLTLLR
jgi:hypothetical protein